MDNCLPPEFWQGADQFNRGEFYACHDTLEALWTEALEPDRTFYQGLLQLAVSLYHLSNHNWRGAVTLMGEAIGRLRRYEVDYGGVDLAPVLSQCREILELLQHRGPEAVAEVATQLGLGSGAIASGADSTLPRVRLPQICPGSTPPPG